MSAAITSELSVHKIFVKHKTSFMSSCPKRRMKIGDDAIKSVDWFEVRQIPDVRFFLRNKKLFKTNLVLVFFCEITFYAFRYWYK